MCQQRPHKSSFLVFNLPVLYFEPRNLRDNRNSMKDLFVLENQLVEHRFWCVPLSYVLNIVNKKLKFYIYTSLWNQCWLQVTCNWVMTVMLFRDATDTHNRKHSPNINHIIFQTHASSSQLDSYFSYSSFVEYFWSREKTTFRITRTQTSVNHLSVQFITLQSTPVIYHHLMNRLKPDNWTSFSSPSHNPPPT